MSGSVPFWRFLPDPSAADATRLRQAGREGKGSLARVLREARQVHGDHRSSALLKAARDGEVGFGMPLRVLVASPFQPRSILAALDIAFAIAGFSAACLQVDGHAALDALLADDTSTCPLDLALMPLFAGDPARLDLTLRLAERLAAHRHVPVLVMPIGGGGSESVPASPVGVEIAPVIVAGPAADERFAASFGLLPSPAAAERLADVAAGFAARVRGTAPKLLVTDLDGTLWQGTLGEDGAEVLELNDAYAEALKAASRAGLVLAIASRNDPAEVDSTFACHPEWPLFRADFAALAVGWDAKDDLVARCLKATGLGTEHMLVVDDDVVNCARLAVRFPQADIRHFDQTRPDEFARSLANDPLLAGSGHSGERAEQYRRREAVERLRGEAVDVGDFLRRLDTRLEAEPLRPELLPRAAELAVRVNQFALTDFRPNAIQLAARRSPLDFMLRLTDAFGAHGLVGLVLAHREDDVAVLDNLLLSCRALGRSVEDAMLAALAEHAARLGCWRLRTRVEDLPRNEPARRWFSRLADPSHPAELTADISSDAFPLPQSLSLTWKTANS